MKRARFVVIGAALLGGTFVPGAAQAGSLALMLDGGLRTMSNSSETEKAIFGTKRGIGGGLGVFYDRGAHLRFGVEARRIRRDGERAFAADRTSPAFRLGHPLAFTVTEALVSTSFRFGKIGPIVPYVGVGGGFASWKERSDIAGVTESASGTAGLLEARAGLERQQGSVRLAVEGGITFVMHAVGAGGISQVYGESDLGGAFVVGKIGFSRK